MKYAISLRVSILSWYQHLPSLDQSRSRQSHNLSVSISFSLNFNEICPISETLNIVWVLTSFAQSQPSVLVAYQTAWSRCVWVSISIECYSFNEFQSQNCSNISLDPNTVVLFFIVPTTFVYVSIFFGQGLNTETHIIVVLVSVDSES